MRVLVIISILICLGTIVLGNFHWKNKIAGVIEGERIENNSSMIEWEQEEGKEGGFEQKLSNLPPAVSKFLASAANQEESVELAIIGSEANTRGERPWPEIFADEIEEAYGDFIHISLYEIPETTTSDIINQDLLMPMIDDSPDIVILEPFILNNHGEILIDHTVEHIITIVQDLKEMNSDVYFFLQPPHPLYNATYYPRDVQELQYLAEREGHAFIDHWQNWPDYHTEEIKEYILSDSSAPNEKGHAVWAEYIANLFINKAND